MIPPFKKVHFEDADMQRFQSNVANAFGPVLGNPILDTVLIKDVFLLSGQDNLVPHNLQRRPVMWIPVKRDANAVIWEQPTTFETKFLNLHVSANCTASVLVG